MARFRLSAAAQSDIIDILAWTHEHFGPTARLRYEALMAAALRDVSSQPDRLGSIARPELGKGVRSWHLRLSREHLRPDTGRVRNPRHFLLYRSDADLTIVGRVLHDAMELSHHLQGDDFRA